MGLSLISSTGAISGSTADVEITNLDGGTYKALEFHFYDLHPSAAYADFEFQVNTSYNQNINSTAMRFWAHDNTSHSNSVGYQSSADQHVGASSGTWCCLSETVNSGNAENSLSGVMTLYDPASTTYVKHFISKTDTQTSSTYQQYTQVAGYVDTTSAVDKIKFRFGSGNIDSGMIKVFGYS